MPLIDVQSHGVTGARLFKLSRRALGLSINEIQDELCIMDRSTICKIERGQIDVYGPTWRVLRYLLQEKNRNDLVELVDIFCDAIRGAARARREAHYAKYYEEQEEETENEQEEVKT